MKKRIIIFTIIIAVITAVAIIPAVLFFNGFMQVNPSKEEYPVRGVDVSSYQGKIDWQTLSEQGIDFAFIKQPRAVPLPTEILNITARKCRKPLSDGGHTIFSATTAEEIHKPIIL